MIPSAYGGRLLIVSLMLRLIIPQSVKRHLKLALRTWSDWRSGISGKFARRAPHKCGSSLSFDHKIHLSQPILNATDEQSRLNKIHNIHVAAASIETVNIQPGEVFSFWRVVGSPSRKNKFKPGINIIRGKITEDYGGGLCQLSGIIYHLSLIAGLTILERVNHSVDLYHDQDRYTPLGADCAVFYGYKDLRFRNDHNHAVQFRFEISDDRLVAYLESPEAIEDAEVTFETLWQDDTGTEIVTRKFGKEMTRSRYEMPGMRKGEPVRNGRARYQPVLTARPVRRHPT